MLSQSGRSSAREHEKANGNRSETGARVTPLRRHLASKRGVHSPARDAVQRAGKKSAIGAAARGMAFT